MSIVLRIGIVICVIIGLILPDIIVKLLRFVYCPHLFNSKYQLLFMLYKIYLREDEPAYKLDRAHFLIEYYLKKRKIQKIYRWNVDHFVDTATRAIKLNCTFNESAKDSIVKMLEKTYRANIYFIRYFFEQGSFDYLWGLTMFAHYESGKYIETDYSWYFIGHIKTIEPPNTQINANKDNSVSANRINENEGAIPESIKSKEDTKQIVIPTHQNNQPIEKIIHKRYTNTDNSVFANQDKENEKAIPEDIKSNLEPFRTAGWLDADYQPIENLIIDKNGIPLDDQNKNQKGQEYNKNTYTLTKNMYAAIGYAVCIGYKSPKNQKPKYATIMSKIWHNTTPDQIKSNYNYYKNTYRELPMSDAKGFERLLSKILCKNIDFSTKEEK